MIPYDERVFITKYDLIPSISKDVVQIECSSKIMDIKTFKKNIEDNYKNYRWAFRTIVVTIHFPNGKDETLSPVLTALGRKFT